MLEFVHSKKYSIVALLFVFAFLTFNISGALAATHSFYAKGEDIQVITHLKVTTKEVSGEILKQTLKEKMTRNDTSSLQVESNAAYYPTAIVYETTGTKKEEWKSLVGLTVATQEGTVKFRWDTDGYLYDQGRSLTHNTWAFPPNSWSDEEEGWNYFYPGYNGTGEAYFKGKLTFGIPTPWGPIGTQFQSSFTISLNGWGEVN